MVGLLRLQAKVKAVVVPQEPEMRVESRGSTADNVRKPRRLGSLRPRGFIQTPVDRHRSSSTSPNNYGVVIACPHSGIPGEEPREKSSSTRACVPGPPAGRWITVPIAAAADSSADASRRIRYPDATHPHDLHVRGRKPLIRAHEHISCDCSIVWPLADCVGYDRGLQE